MYAGCVAYCPVASHGEYANGRDRRQSVTLHFLLDAASVIKCIDYISTQMGGLCSIAFHTVISRVPYSFPIVEIIISRG